MDNFILKNINYLPQFFPKFWTEEYGVYGISFTDDVSIGFILKSSNSYSFLLNDDFNHLEVSEEELYNKSFDNLRNISDSFDIHVAEPNGSKVIWWFLDDNFNAVRLLLPEVVNYLKSELGENFLFTIPSLGNVLCWKIASSSELTEKHLKEAIEDFGSEEKQLSPNIYIYDNIRPLKHLNFENISSHQKFPPAVFPV